MLQQIQISTYLTRGDSLEALEKMKSSLVVYNRAIQSDPESIKAYLGKSRVLIKLGKTELALKALDNALKIDPTSIEVWGHKGVTLFVSKRYEETFFPAGSGRLDGVVWRRLR